MNSNSSTNEWFNINNDIVRESSSWSSLTAAPSGSQLFCSGLKNGPCVLNSSMSIRLAFLRKVYLILFLTLGLTMLVCASIMFITSIQISIVGKQHSIPPQISTINFILQILKMSFFKKSMGSISKLCGQIDQPVCTDVQTKRVPVKFVLTRLICK